MLINIDFDGVIADTFDRLFALCIAAQKSVARGRAPVKEDLHNLENLTFEGMAHRLQIPSVAISEFQQTAFRLQQKEAVSVDFFPGMAPLLNRLGQHNDIAIITSSSAKLVRAHLAEHDVLDSIFSVSGGETGRSKKQSILVNMEQSKASSQQTCMIGDAVSDIRQGKEAEVVTIGVCWGFHAVELIARENPDYLANDPAELLAILSAL